MAKGNMLLGQSRGKLGDVVFTRLNGEQIARPRVRHPRNPQTNKQLYQRAIMATVMQAYSSGIEIFDHSFEGKGVGAENQRYFMKINAKKLRADIAADINGNVALASQIGRATAPGVMTPVPALYQVSEGSLLNTLVVNGQTTANLTDETCAEYCARLGLTTDDVFTVVAISFPKFGSEEVFSLEEFDDSYSKIYNASFGFMRYKVKASAFTSSEKALTLSDILDEANVDGNLSAVSDFSSLIYLGDPFRFSGVYDRCGTFAVIRSKENLDLRSSESMIVDDGGGSNVWGLASSYILQAWKQGTQALGDSDLILEGGDI